MRRVLAAVAILATVLTTAGIAQSQTGGSGERASAAQAEKPVSGRFTSVLMVHTKSQTYGDLPGVKPWDGTFRAGELFSYRSIPCTGNAPVNNIGTDLTTYNARVPGSRVPGSIRAHPFAFRLNRKDGRWRMQGYIELVACKLGPGPTPANDPVPDAQKPRILIRFFAGGIRKVNAETLSFNGRFVIRGGTGRYRDLRGSGDLAGYFLCFDPAGCASKGSYADAQLTFQGSYTDPTPELAG